MKEVAGGARVVAFRVASLARARRFYVDRLGFRVVREEPGAFVTVNLGSFRLSLDLERDAAKRGRATLIFKTLDVGRTARELDRRGVAYEHHSGARAGDYLEVGDPDGNTVVFTEKL